MARLSASLLALFALLIQYQSCKTFILFDLSDDIKKCSEIAKALYFKIYNKTDDNIKTQQKYEYIASRMDEVLTVNKDMFDIMEESKSELQRIPKLMYLEDSMRKISEAMSVVEYNYMKFLDFSELHVNLLNRAKHYYTVDNFAKFALSSDTSGLRYHLSQIHSKFVQDRFSRNRRSSVLHGMLEFLEEFKNICNTKKSLNMILAELYSAIIKTEIKALVVMHFALDVLGDFKGGKYDFQRDLELIEKESDSRAEKVKKVFKKTLKQSSRSVWACESEKARDYFSLTQKISVGKNVYLNLDRIEADFNERKIITGARFSTRDIIIGEETAAEIYLEIQQGKLLINRTIDASSLSWKFPPDNEDSKRTKVDPGDEIWLAVQDNHDSYYEHSFYLVALELKFVNKSFISLQTYVTDDEELNMRILYAPMEYTLPLDQKEQDDNQNLQKLIATLNETKEYTFLKGSYMGVPESYIDPSGDQALCPQLLNLYNKTSPAECSNDNKIIKRYYNSVRFTESSAKNYRNQLIIPLIDLQEVVTDPPTPLSGAALYYKESEGCGGFLGIELRTLGYDKRIRHVEKKKSVDSP